MVTLRGLACSKVAVEMGRGMPDLYTTGMSKLVCKGWAVAKSRTRVSEISSSS